VSTFVVIYGDPATRQVYGWFTQAEGPEQAEREFSKHVALTPREVKTVQETRLATIDTFLELYKYRESEELNA
jgi:hypothetical protein